MGYFNFVTRWFAGKAAQGKAKGEANAAIAKSKTMDAAESAKANTQNAGESVANTASTTATSAEHTTEAAAHNTGEATSSAINAPVEKAKGHRPKASHHDSVDKIKQAFHIKDKHSTGSKAAVTAEP